MLIVETDAVAALELEHLLTRAGHKVVGTARSFSEVRETARFRSAELALIKYRLAGAVGGVTLARYLRRQGAKVIYVTARPEAVRRKDRGADIVAKPYCDEKLLGTIRRALSD